MYPIIHLLIGIIPAFLFSLISKELAISFLLASILIDLDHIFNYFYYYKGLNFIEIYNFYVYRKKTKRHIGKQIYIFHTIEFLVIATVVIATFNKNIAFGVFWGLLFHTGCDLLEGLIDKIKQNNHHFKPFSIIYYTLKYHPKLQKKPQIPL